jgi:trypsin-like peptidase
MKRWFCIVVVLLIAAAGLFLGCRKSGQGDDDEACVTTAAREFTRRLPPLEDTLRAQFEAQLTSQSEKQLTQQRTMRSAGTERELLAIVREERGEFACLFPPLSVTDSDIQVYPRKRAPNCPIDQHLPPKLSDGLKKRFRAVADSVGQLQIVDAKKTATFWGTGFVISQNYVATTCHIVDPLLNDSNMLQLGDKETMVIEFQNPARQCQIDPTYVTCSAHQGLDVALLKVVKDSCKTTGSMPNPSSLPPPVLLDDEAPSKLTDTQLAVIGYGDLDHPIDANTDELYSPFKGSGYNKFLMLDFAPAVENCGGDKGRLNILLDAASTTVGESGGVLVKVGKVGDSSPLGVVGVHTCCSTFFSGQEKGIPPESGRACTKVRRTFDNQDVSIKSVLDDATLCAVLKQDGIACSGNRR